MTQSDQKNSPQDSAAGLGSILASSASSAFARVDQALVAGSDGGVEQALAMIQELEKQARFRLQWALVDRLWAIAKTQPWIDRVALDWDSSHQTFVAGRDIDWESVNAAVLREHMETPALREAMEKNTPNFLRNLAPARDIHDETLEFFAAHYFADSVDGSANPQLMNLWKSVVPSDGPRTWTVELDTRSRDKIAQCLLSPESLAAWEAACLRVALGEPSPDGASAAQAMSAKAGSLRL